MKGLRHAGVLSAAAVIVILGALYGLAGLHRTVSLAAGTAPHQPRVVPVTSVTRACPDPGSAASPGSGIAVMSAPAGARAGSASRAGLTVNRLAGPGSTTPGAQLPASGQPGSPLFAVVATDRAGGTKAAKGQGTGGGQVQKAAAGTVPSGPARGGVVIQAAGALAQGLEVEQTAGGLPTAACGSPGTDFWFTGPGQRTAGRIQLYLMNPSSQAADADADIFTDAGPLQETTDTGITVPPHGMIVQTLAGTLRNSRAITLHVRTSVGQVVAAVQESTGAGQGAWLPAAQPPATRLVIPGLPAIAGTRQLYVAVPGMKDANVQVTAVTSRGSYQPTGASGIDLPGRFRGRDLAALGGRDPGGAPADLEHPDHRLDPDPGRLRRLPRVLHGGRAGHPGAGRGRLQHGRPGPLVVARPVRPAARRSGHRDAGGHGQPRPGGRPRWSRSARARASSSSSGPSRAPRAGPLSPSCSRRRPGPGRSTPAGRSPETAPAGRCRPCSRS